MKTVLAALGALFLAVLQGKLRVQIRQSRSRSTPGVDMAAVAPASPAAVCDNATVVPTVALDLRWKTRFRLLNRTWPFQLEMTHLARLRARNSSTKLPDYASLGYTAPGRGGFGVGFTIWLFIRNATLLERGLSDDVWLTYANLDRPAVLYAPLVSELHSVRGQLQSLSQPVPFAARAGAFLAQLVHQQAVMEGTRWTFQDVQTFVQTGKSPAKTRQSDRQVAQGMLRAFNSGVAYLERHPNSWNATLLALLHKAACSSNPAIESSALGRVRSLPTENVIVGERVAPAAWFEVPQLVARLLTGLHRRLHCSNRDDTEQVLRRAFDLYTNLNFVHPFLDCNGRTLSVLLNLHLMQNHLPPVIFALWSDVKHQLVARQEAAYLGDRSDFYGFLMESMLRTGQSYLAAIGH